MRVLVCDVPKFKVGDPAPDDYMAWHEWARVQHRGGLRQKRTTCCLKYLFPQETCKCAKGGKRP